MAKRKRRRKRRSSSSTGCFEELFFPIIVIGIVIYLISALIEQAKKAINWCADFIEKNTAVPYIVLAGIIIIAAIAFLITRWNRRKYASKAKGSQNSNPKATKNNKPVKAPVTTNTPNRTNNVKNHQINTFVGDSDYRSRDTVAMVDMLSDDEKNSPVMKQLFVHLNGSGYSRSELVETLSSDGFSSEEINRVIDRCGANWTQQATKKASKHLKHQSFSYEGLMLQLINDGFSNLEAQYAVNSCHANWNDQALKRARRYLEHNAFSRAELNDCLINDRFTAEQATFAVDHCGANWKKQASKRAADYMECANGSVSDVLLWLIDSGFTRDEAKYGVEAV